MHVNTRSNEVTPESCANTLGVLHIALDVLLADGHPLDAVLLFALSSLGGLNCIKVQLS